MVFVGLECFPPFLWHFFEQSAGEVVKSELAVVFLTSEILDLIIF